MIFIVLGMHKSGTTLLARALHESGISMGQDFPSGIDYAKAKYEARWVQDVNDEILGVDRAELSLRVTTSLLPRSGIESGTKEKMVRGIEEAQMRYSQWGFKDPRAVLTYPYWKETLPDHRLVIVYRNPIEVWKRYSSFNHPGRLRLPFKTWCDYNRQILAYSQATSSGQSICLNFERLLSGREEWQRLQEFVGVDLVDVCDPAQSINRVSEQDRSSPGYRILSLMAGREASRILQNLDALRTKEK